MNIDKQIKPIVRKVDCMPIGELEETEQDYYYVAMLWSDTTESRVRCGHATFKGAHLTEAEALACGERNGWRKGIQAQTKVATEFHYLLRPLLGAAVECPAAASSASVVHR